MLDTSNVQTPVLSVRGLKTHFFTRKGVARAVDGIDLTVNAGEIVGLVGESGSGKSITGFSLIGLVAEPGRIVEGAIELEGRNLLSLSPREMRKLRGNRLSMIFQDPMMSLNPLLRVETQLIETVQAHENVSEKAARARALDALVRIGIPAPEQRLQAYPHQLSGGMRQRVAIAMALINRPRLVIADEPTTALDVTIQSQILYEVQNLCRESGTAMIWITHDLGIVAGLADRIAVMYAGRIVETGTTDQVLNRPLNPYTRALMRSIPQPGAHGSRLRQISGMAPSLLALPKGCAFSPRCPNASEICDEQPPAYTAEAGWVVRCWKAMEQEAAR
ncbi:ABC transporter ATP-binding protein [Tianweitania sp.]|uniref:ABC transporter ATP-binding protein n=1 Tax=Tianweitania sp. TaxID=2021634 RepID=UPI0028967B3D|nr:ABC transporter ATP-binding protein [Tianweitania sp.]